MLCNSFCNIYEHNKLYHYKEVKSQSFFLKLNVCTRCKNLKVSRRKKS